MRLLAAKEAQWSTSPLERRPYRHACHVLHSPIQLNVRFSSAPPGGARGSMWLLRQVKHPSALLVKLGVKQTKYL